MTYDSGTSDPSVTGPLPYGTADEPRVAVRGEASLEFDPEIARIAVQVSVRGTDRREALESLTRRNSEVLELLKGYGEAVEKLSTGAFSVSPELSEKGRRERVRTYNGRVHISATVADFTALGEMTTRLADMDMTTVDGPWWALRTDSPAHREARQQAVREAVTRAREYAGALGAELVALLELADLGAESAPPPAPAGMRSASYGGPPAGGAAPALDLEPKRQRVQAQVNARFLMTRPAL
ncbi:SIMPL domain-containing protein [Streptomyces albidus (ex Kaewkla and Franco 2022)]|uniref:SIMPL domain-containing protein n=1 Tax=Streptomyces albidus (ex Kaewkla and Franco 2022) TaxID=722709 RepID=UPI0015EF3D19|nr:SIMPL domain-containing protein [Streptomyces albidus (ex Kaewkla and Franco 2022)]